MPNSGGLTPDQMKQATTAAKDILWHQRQIERLNRLYERATSGQNVAEAERIGGVMDAHNRSIDTARAILESLGF